MAQDRIDITVGTKADPSGFNVMTRGAQDMGNAGKKAKEAFANLLGSMRGVDGAVGQVANGFEILANSMAAYGALGAVVGAAQIASNIWLEKTREAQEAEVELYRLRRQNTDIMLQAVLKKKVEDYAAAIKGVKENLVDTNEQFKLATIFAKTIADTMLRVQGAKGASSIADIQIEKLNAIMAEEDKAAHSVIAAKYDLAAAEKKAALDNAARADKLKAEEKAVDDNRKALATASAAVMEFEKAIAPLKKEVARYRNITNNGIIGSEIDRQHYASIQAKLTDATARLAEARKQEKAAAQNVASSEAKLELEKATAATAEKQSQISVLSATKSLRDAEEAAAEAIKKQAEEAKRAAEATRKKKEEEELAAQAEREITDRANFRIKQIDERIAILDKKIADALKSTDRANLGVATDHRVSNGGAAYDYKRNAAGNIADFADWQRAQRYAARGERDAMALERGNAAHARRAERIQAKIDSGKKISAQDQAFIDNWNKFQNEKNAGNLQKEKDQLEKERNEAVVKMRDDLAEIKENIKEALEIR